MVIRGAQDASRLEAWITRYWPLLMLSCLLDSQGISNMRVHLAVAIGLTVCAWPVLSVGARLQLEPQLPVPDLPDPTYSGYVAVDRYGADM